MAYGALDFANSSNSKDISQWWKFLWNLNIPPKIKSVAWQVCMNWLPVFKNLRERGVDVYPYCFGGGVAPELISHSLWTCH